MRTSLYIPTNFETRLMAEPTAQNRIGSNAVGRILNSITNTFNSNKDTVPKWIIISETDIMKSVEYSDFGVSGAYGTVVDYIMKELNSHIKFITSGLPFKSIKYDYPNILWIEPSLHIRYTDITLRMKYIKSLHIAAQTHDRMIVLPFEQCWNPQDTALVFPDGNINPIGLKKYCLALDATVKFANVKLMRNYGLLLKQVFQKPKIEHSMNTRLAAFERLSHLDDAKRAQLQRDWQMRRQYQHIRAFFERREDLQARNNRASGSTVGSIGTQENRDGEERNTNNNANGSQHRHRCPGRQHHHNCRRRLFKK